MLSSPAALQVENVKNNLVLQLEILGRWLAVLVVVIALIAFLLAMFHAGNNFKAAFESAVAVAVSIIPEGLPAMVRAWFLPAMVRPVVLVAARAWLLRLDCCQRRCLGLCWSLACPMSRDGEL